jgi:hypothetical protein
MLDWGEGGTFSGQQAIEKHYAVDFASSPPELAGKLTQVYTIGEQLLQRSLSPETSNFFPHFAHWRKYLGETRAVDVAFALMPRQSLFKNWSANSVGVLSALSLTLIMFSASAIFLAPF